MEIDSLRLQGRVSQRWVYLLLLLGFSVLIAGAVSAAPIVISKTPAAGETEVPATAMITATFSEPMDPATITSGSITLSQPVRIKSIAAGNNYTVALSDNGTVTGWGYNGYGQTAVPNGLGGVTAIAAGSDHTVALKNDGTVVAWGENTWGQSTTPAGLSAVIAIAAGANFTLTLRSDETVVAWGDNSRGQTGVPGGLAGVIRIAAGGAHALALKSDGTVVAWGDDSFGQATVPPGLSGVIAVAAGFNHSLALKADGSVVAWGADNNGQTSVPAGLSGVSAIAARSDYTVALKDDGTVVAWGDNTSGQSDVPAGLSGIAAITAGYYHAVALKNDGTVVSWGDNSCSQTTLPAGLSGVAAAAAGSAHTVALKSDGKLFAWGYNSSGQADIPAGVSGVTALAAGFAHTIALSDSGAVSAWGSNDSGQATVPAGLAGVLAVAAGDNHSVALKNDGTIVAWGQNSSGQATVPGGLAGVTKIAAGSAHTLALKQDGTVTAWGSNAYNAISPPVGLSGVTAIAVAGYHSVALKNDGTLSAWGENTWGQSTIPPGLTAVSAISAGNSHTVALKSDGTVVAWGKNDLGQSSVPAGLSGVVDIAAGNGYTIAVKNDGTLVSWGDNKIGQSTVPQDPYRREIATAISYSTGSNSATITPGSSLPLATTLTATVNTGVRSLDGTHPAADYSWSFTTVTPPVTTASPGGGIYTAAQDVTLTANEPATIYYTTNGSDPTVSSPVYSGPIRIMLDTILKFFARDPAGNNEAVKTENYSFTVDTTPPVTSASPGGGTYSAAQSVTLTASEPATIYYTTNGNDPTVSSPVYSGPIQILVSTILKFFGRDTAGNNEAVKSANYTLNLDTTPPVTSASPGGGTYSAAQSVTLTASEPATIYYTTNGNDPTVSSPVYSGPIQILVSTILKFFGRDTAGNNEAVRSETYSIKQNQTIAFAPLPAKAYGDPSFALGATASSGLPVSYTSSNTSVATVSGSTVTIVGAGTTTITASQGGDGNYNVAPEVAQPLAVNKAAATVTLGSLSTTYDGTPKEATVTTVPAGLNVTLTYNGAAPAPTAVASYTVVGSVSDPNYQGSASGTMTIAKGNQTVTFGGLSVKTYGDSAFTLTATASSGLAVTYTSSNSAVATVSGSTVTIVGAGTAVITANQSGDANYNAAPAVAQTLTINKAPATITFGLLTFTYDGNPKPVTVTTIPTGLAVAITYDGSATAPTDVGNYTVVATVNNANYQGTATATEEIAKKSQTITFGPLPVKTYGDAPFLFSADASSNLNLTFEYDTTVATITKQGQKYLLTIVGAGTTIVTATQPGNRNYSDASPVSQTLTVNKAAGTVTLGSLSAIYDGSAKAATATTTPAGRAVSFTYNGSATAPIAAGSYSVIGTINDANYQGSASGTQAIAKASQTITFGALPAKSYGNAPFNLNATASSGLAISYTSSNPAVATLSGTTVTIVGAGTTTITASQGGDGNYNAASSVSQTLTVNSAPAASGKTAVTIGTTTSYYDTVTAALAAIPAGSTTTIKLQTMTFAEAVNINISGATVSITGGYDSGFTSAAGMTTIQGSLTIGAGALIADKLVIM